MHNMAPYFLRLSLVCSLFGLSTAALPRGIDSGHHFLISLPKFQFDDDTEVAFYMSTMALKPVQITIQAVWVEGSAQESTMGTHSVERLELLKYIIDRLYFNNTKETGKYSSFRLDGDGEFTLMVAMATRATSLDTFVAVPVNGWGSHYYAATFHYKPSISVITNEGPNKITIKIIVGPPNKFEATYFGRAYKNGDTIVLELKRFEAFTLSNCTHLRTVVGALTGTEVRSFSPVGVITGTCMFDVKEKHCGSQSSLKIDSQDIVSDMLLPAETYGKEFTTVSAGSKDSVIYVVTGESDTVVKIHANVTGEPLAVTLAHEGDVFKHDLVVAVTSIYSNKGVMVMLFVSGVCHDNPNNSTATPAFLQIIPDSLFFDNYVWITPKYKNDEVNNFFTIVRKLSDSKYLIFDSKPLQNVIREWAKVIGKELWQAGSAPTVVGVHNVYGGHGVYFGCYVYGYASSSFGYFSAAGFMSVPINSACQKITGHAGDLVDNDCDGWVDEEKYNGIDDDKDTLIDEDLAKPNRRNGIWGHWLEWSCSRNCTDTFYHRKRLCDSPEPLNYGLNCPGGDSERKDGTCYVTKKCPSDCELGLWDLNCEKSCFKCVGDCDKFDGSCESCQKGFKQANESCSRHCDEYEYGSNCAGDCRLKCGVDCEERVDGTCSGSWWKYAYGLIGLWLVPIMAVVAWKYCSCSDKDDDEDLSAYTSTSSSSTSV